RARCAGRGRGAAAGAGTRLGEPVRSRQRGSVAGVLELAAEGQGLSAVDQQAEHREHRDEGDDEQDEDLAGLVSPLDGLHQWLTTMVELPESVKEDRPRRDGTTRSTVLLTTTVIDWPRALFAPGVSVLPTHPTP